MASASERTAQLHFNSNPEADLTNKNKKKANPAYYITYPTEFEEIVQIPIEKIEDQLGFRIGMLWFTLEEKQLAETIVEAMQNAIELNRQGYSIEQIYQNYMRQERKSRQ